MPAFRPWRTPTGPSRLPQSSPSALAHNVRNRRWSQEVDATLYLKRGEVFDDEETERRVFTATESADVWDRWQRGEGLKLIGRVFGRTSSSIFQHLKPHGGIRPAPRRRSRRVLGLDDREGISRGIATGVSLRAIARQLGRAPSTISRELRRSGGQGRYRATAADKRAWDRASRPKVCKLAKHEELRQLVAARSGFHPLRTFARGAILARMQLWMRDLNRRKLIGAVALGLLLLLGLASRSCRDFPKTIGGHGGNWRMSSLCAPRSLLPSMTGKSSGKDLGL